MSADRRKTLIAKAHIARAQLGMDEATYRAVLQRVTGKTSAGDCTVPELAALMNEFLRLGFSPAHRPQRGKRPGGSAHPEKISDAQLAKIEALLAEKGHRQGGAVHWAYADALALRLCGVTKVQWLRADQAGKVIAALEYDRRRHATPPIDVEKVRQSLYPMGMQRRQTIDRLCDAIAAKKGLPPGAITAATAAWETCQEESDRWLTPEEADRVIAWLQRYLKGLSA